MILVSGSHAEQINQLPLSGLEKQIVQKKRQSTVEYHYDSLEALEFELKMRTKIMEAAYAFDDSRIKFVAFNKARCNKQFWTLTEHGGFELKSGVLPSDAIRDIFRNGRLYATECATAILIIFYKAVLDMIGTEVFNAFFKDLYLRDWNYDSDLQLVLLKDKDEAYPGDALYFKNPDYNQAKPEWQGENVVMVGDNLYFGHGLGIRTGEGFIIALNKIRKPSAAESAYLTDVVVHPVFEYLRKLSIRDKILPIQIKHIEMNAIVARIGSKTHIYRKKVG